MPISNYGGGFANGVTIRELPILNTYGGNNPFWVDSGAGSDGNPGTFQRPFGTIDFAIGRCTASNGDIVMVKPGHAETVTADEGIDLDVAGVAVVGLGEGALRPTITFTTAAGANFTMAAASTSIRNLLFLCNINDQTRMVSVEADDCTVQLCEFRDGSANPLVSLGASDGVDRLVVIDCKFYNPDTDNDSAISITATATAATGHRFEHNWIHGDYDLGAIDLVDDTAAVTDMLIRGNVIENLRAGGDAIDMDRAGAASNVTGQIVDNRVVTDAEETSIFAGGMDVLGNSWANGTSVSLTPSSAADGSQMFSWAFDIIYTATAADEIATVGLGPIMVTGIYLMHNVDTEGEAAAVFDNIVAGTSGNLYTADQEFAAQASVLDPGEVLALGSGGAQVLEASANTEDQQGLQWLLVSGDTIDVEGGSGAAEGNANVLITYVSLGGDLEVEGA